MKNYYQLHDKWRCAVCQREFTSRQAVTTHIHRTHENPGVVYGGRVKGKTTAWNKGLKGVQVSPMKGKPGKNKGKTLEEIVGIERATIIKQKISRRMSVNNKGGRSKWYDVAGQKVQGTWERNVALKFEELGIKWKKLKTNKDILEYVMDGKVRCYTPDFYLPAYNVFLEVKGRWWGRDREKMDIVLKTYPDKNIIIVEKEQYEKILEGELVWSFQRISEEDKNQVRFLDPPP